MRMRQLSAGTPVLSALLLFCFSACAASEHPITFAGDKSFPPVEYLEQDVPKGLNIDLLKELSKAMGRELDIRLMHWEDAQQKVLNGEIDAITTMSISEKRKELYDFSEITLKYQYSIFVRTDQVGIQTVADLEGKTVGVTKGGFPKQVLESNPQIKLVIIEDYLEGFRLLLSQEIDAVGADRWVGAYTLQKNSIHGITIRGEPFAEKLAGIAVKKGNKNLLNEINHGIAKLKNDGTIKKIEDKWAPKEVLFITREQIHEAIMYMGFTLLVAVVGAALFWILSLRKQVRLKTHELASANRELQEKIAALDDEILERKRAEAELRHYMARLKESNEALQEFAYIASHDLQEPLRMVSSYTQLLAKRYKGKLDERADEFIGFAVDGAKRMQRLIDDLLTYSRMGATGKSFVKTDCESVLQQALAHLERAISENDGVITYDPLPTIAADETQLVQLFQNLIGNAVKFHGDKPPQVHISASKVSAHKGEDVSLASAKGKRDGAEVRDLLPEAHWLFSVHDNGIGIDSQHAERIFAIFQRLHTMVEYPGTGIGLAICRKIVERHGGRIWAESQVGKGSTFFFTLPTSRIAEEA